MKTFKVNKNLEAVCQSEKTRYGFRHLATLIGDRREISKAKRCYYNRTWESYEFESVLETLLEKSISLSEWDKRCFKAMIKNGGQHSTDDLKTIGMVAMMGDIFGKTQKQKNDWKTRMLKAGLENKGLIMPDDWETLSEADKEARLDGAIKAIV